MSAGPPLAAIDRLAAVLELGEQERGELRAAREGHRGRELQESAHPSSGSSVAGGFGSVLVPLPLPRPATPLIGRVAERAAVHAALGASRLVTLTGVAGTGKTRLALQVAREATDAGAFADGVAFVDLAPLRDPSLLVLTVARGLGLVEDPTLLPEAQLIAALQPRHLLLVVDNLEHLLEEAPLLGRLLAAAPRLHLLATSRVPLRLYGEHEIRVPPLALPPGDAGPVGGRALPDPAASEAVQLFVARARAVVRGLPPPGQPSRQWPASARPWTACRWPSSWLLPGSISSLPKPCCRGWESA